MDDQPKNVEPKKDFNKLDLSQLGNFSFGTQWTQDKPEAGDGGSRGRDDRARRDGPAGDPKRDRRGFKRPAGPGGPGEPSGDRPRPAFADRDRRPRPSGPGENRGPAEGGEARPAGERPREDRSRPPFRGGDRRREGGPPAAPMGPYISPYFEATFYPEDVSFTALAKTIRASCRTFELFEIARTVIGKPDRFVVVLQRKPGQDPADAKRPFYVSVPDSLPFDTEEAAVNHVMTHHLDRFFSVAEVEVDPPKGSFQVINKCGVTGALLGPPNYHLYNQAVQQHHAAKVARMPFETFRSRIETVRDPEVVNAWLELMKKVTRYTWKSPGAAAPAPAATSTAEETPVAVDAPEAEAPVDSVVDAPADVAVETEAAAAPATGPFFDSLNEARGFLLTQVRDKVIRTYEHGRFHGHALEKMPDSEIKRAVEGALDRQRRFPLDTANALRGRLRREGFTIFKKGSKGVSYVCAVKRKFRTPGQTFADSIDRVITFIEQHPMVRLSELAERFLGITLPAAPAEVTVSAEDQARIKRMQLDLRWLITEGYVTEFQDGTLFAAPPMSEPKAKAEELGEGEEFPQAPAPAPVARVAPAAKAAPVAEPVETTEEAPAAEAAVESVAETEAEAEIVATAAPEAETDVVETPTPEPTPAADDDSKPQA